MERIAWQQRIVVDPEIHHGEPCIKGTRIPARRLVGSLADGLTIEQILAAYPQLAGLESPSSLALAVAPHVHPS
jgi:uncharacterized protein (DUF433 family)